MINAADRSIIDWFCCGVLVSFFVYLVGPLLIGTRVYEVKKDIRLENGSTIVKGTKFKEWSMPEGYDTLKIYVNVPRGDIGKFFEVEIDGRGNWVNPYWMNE